MSDQPLLATEEGPLIPASQHLPEITVRGLCLGVLLTIILGSANAYLGLKVGQTVSASIPAAIISMSCLRFFRRSNVLENTMVQTMASVGEALISGVAFILPALIILHTWDHFYYWQTVSIALLGGTLGVLFTIPLRRALLVDKILRYPEGIAISNVFKANETNDAHDIKTMSLGGAVGGVIAFCQTGLQILSDHWYCWFKTSTSVFGFGLGFSPALLAAGYIVGINASLSILVGIIIGWIIGVPCVAIIFGMPHLDSATDIAMAVWRTHIRNIGVGTMLVGGLWTLGTLYKPIAHGLSTSFASIRALRNGEQKAAILRTDRDMPIHYVLGLIILLAVPIFIILTHNIMPPNTSISSSFRLLLGVVTTSYVIIGGFLFCAIAAYFAGLIGSTNTPVSGLLVSALLLLCLIILGLFKMNGGIQGLENVGVLLGVGATIILGSALAISNDTMQDLKVGQIVGATPWKQQLMLIIGVAVIALVMPGILNLLYNAYGLGGVFPHPGMNKTQMLAAPQAALMATIAQGIYAQNLEWSTIGVGGIIAVICIVADHMLKRFGACLPVLAIGLGIYLPLDASIPVVVGGLLSFLISRRLNKRYPVNVPAREKAIASRRHHGLLLACGMVAGASLIGVVLAIPFALKKSADALSIMPAQWLPVTGILGAIVTLILCIWMYQKIMGAKE